MSEIEETIRRIVREEIRAAMRLATTDQNRDICGSEVYEVGARYEDRDGDLWVFERGGNGELRSTYGSYRQRETLGYVVDTYGPLTKVPS
ncbi:phiSA1p31-related protein [Streptomyces zaomyceticus]|uniref:phiSA1p31-related protein n=1 Tax=Streptomyces zaomyceticus TaxID=68286 RepID=UPI0034356943